jgi:hypothetical protein
MFNFRSGSTWLRGGKRFEPRQVPNSRPRPARRATLGDTGTATLAVAFASAGDHALTAVYGGSSAFDASSSAVLTEDVGGFVRAARAQDGHDTLLGGAGDDVLILPGSGGAGCAAGGIASRGPRPPAAGVL